MENKLIKKIEFKGTIVLKTGLHIGGTNTSMQIGGIDTNVIRNPINNQPFIPGSSLKGKMRSLLQVSTGEILPVNMGNVKNGPTSDKIDAKLFGNAAGGDKQMPSRLIVRDANLKNAEFLLSKTEIPYTEGKTEVVIDRITSAASPRQIERVPAGAEFEFNMVLNIWQQDQTDTEQNETNLINTTFKCLQLLKDDYLGGSGSRGYGQIAINIDDILEKNTDKYYGNPDAKADSIKDKFTSQIEKLKE